MAGEQPEQLTNIIVKVLKNTDLSGIIATRRGGLKPENLPETILSIQSAPHPMAGFSKRSVLWFIVVDQVRLPQGFVPGNPR